MIFRKARGRAEPADDADAPAPDAPAPDPASAPEQAAPRERPSGPRDEAEIDPDDADPALVDLGGLRLTPRPGLELQLQVDEATGTVLAVLVVSEDSALELRPFAAPRSAGIWDEVRREIAAEATRQGGTASESFGDFGPELRLVMPVREPDGSSAVQVSRIVGVDGPRWLLRGTFLGRAVEPGGAGVLDEVFRDVVVVRGSAPMAPREPLPLSVPGSVQLPDEPPVA